MIAFACAVFTSAFLVFQVQPVIARFILPWFGGSPAVWTTCMLFFQLGLLCGYAYAHLLANRIPLARQPYIHLTLVIVSMLALPIAPDLTGAADGSKAPTVDILILLAGSVGFPFVMLSASAPLLQHWFANVHPERSPFRLYALSNLGSLIALLGYPVIVEPSLALESQTLAWSVGYVGFAALSLWCAWPIVARRLASVAPYESPVTHTTWSQRLTWTVLSACGSVVLLATTNQMCQDVAVIPFLWVLPLSLYLLTFIICFDRDSWYFRPVWIPLLVLCVSALLVLLDQDYIDDEMSLGYQIAIYTSAMFTCCMVCHGEMVRRRPATSHLTTFYLYVALGGALGGVLVSVIAPLVFDGFWELHFGLLATAILVGIYVARDRNAISVRPLRYLFSTTWALGTLALAYLLFDHADFQRDESIINARGFYGVLHVYEIDPGTSAQSRVLYHGRISHGEQWRRHRGKLKPTSYYGIDSGADIAITRHPARDNDGAMKVGIIGLGVGTIAAYGREGDTFRFYEINPQVEGIARTYFTYLGQGGADNEVVIGDGRISLARELKTQGPQQFDVLVVDAFSGDAIPIHLLTREAVDLYWQHLKDDGILALHVTNIHVDLFGVVRQLAIHSKRTAIHIEGYANKAWDSSNDWVLITSNSAFLQKRIVRQKTTNWQAPPKPVFWTDDFSNLFQVVDW